MTRNVCSCSGMKARRQTLILNDERTGGKIFLWGVVEVMESDMQDFRQTEPCTKLIETEDGGLPLSVSWIVDYIELEKDFLKNPQEEYRIDRQTVRFIGETRVLEPNENCALILPMDELEKNNLHVVLPKRNCTGYLNVWLDQNRNTEALVNGNTQIQKAISELTLSEMGYDLCLYPHHLGNLYLLSYHPVFRTVDLTCSAEPTGLFVRFYLRKNSDETFTIRVEDYHHQGLCIGEWEFKINVNDRFVFLPLPSEPNNLSISILDGGGCLVYNRSGIRFIKGFSVNVSIGKEKRPAPQRKVRPENYFGSQRTRTEKPKPQEDRMIILGGRAKDKEEAINEARSWIADVLRSANERCYLIDPFFRADDFVTFISPVTEIRANINILISDAMLDKDNAGRLLRVIDDYNQKRGGEQMVRCRISKGERKLHSRMVATEKDAWMISTSFREFGKSPLSIVKMPDDQVKLNRKHLEQMWLDNENTMKLEDYVGN